MLTNHNQLAASYYTVTFSTIKSTTFTIHLSPLTSHPTPTTTTTRAKPLTSNLPEHVGKVLDAEVARARGPDECK
jgi:hypothetical protein